MPPLRAYIGACTGLVCVTKEGVLLRNVSAAPM